MRELDELGLAAERVDWRMPALRLGRSVWEEGVGRRCGFRGAGAGRGGGRWRVVGEESLQASGEGLEAW